MSITDEQQFGRGPEAGDWWEWDPTIRRLHIGLPLAGKSVTQVRALWASWGWDEAQLTADIYADGRASASGPSAIDAVTQSLAVVTYSVASPSPTDSHTNDLYGPCRQYTSAPPTHLMLDVAPQAGTGYERYTWDGTGNNPNANEAEPVLHLPVAGSGGLSWYGSPTNAIASPGLNSTSYKIGVNHDGGMGVAIPDGTTFTWSFWWEPFNDPVYFYLTYLNDAGTTIAGPSLVVVATGTAAQYSFTDTVPTGTTWMELKGWTGSGPSGVQGTFYVDEGLITTPTTPSRSSVGGGGVKQPPRTRKLFCSGTNMVDHDGTVVWDATEPLPPWPPTE